MNTHSHFASFPARLCVRATCRCSAFICLALVIALGLGSCASPGNGMADYSGQLNLSSSSLALSGYDPVSYFDAGENGPQRGSAEFTLEHGGIRYRFAAEVNRNRFLANPARYTPAYGGWCAWAMATGDKVEVNPRSFLIQNERLLLFYDGLFGDTRAMWLAKDVEQEMRAADASWLRILARWRVMASGEPAQEGT